MQELSLRTQWFKLEAINFIKRYAAGLAVILFLLPGVAIGDNLNLILLASIQPFINVVSIQSDLISQISYFSLLSFIFAVWARAQKTAINGGEFAEIMKTLPIHSSRTQRINGLMVLIGNHFLWIFIIYGLIYFTNHQMTLELIRYIYLVLFLFTLQYVMVFKSSQKKLVLLASLSLGLLGNLSEITEWLRIILFTLIWVYLFVLLLTQIPELKPQKTKNLSVKKALINNLYYQMLFKSATTSTWFRVLINLGLLFGFTLTANHFSKINDNNLDVFAFIIEALLAFYLSGFYLLFRDKRQIMKDLLNSLPIGRFYWFNRDFLIVVLISLILHLPFILWQLSYFELHVLVQSWIYHLSLLILAFPLRTFPKDKTLITFAVFMILTIFTVYFLN